MLNGSLICCFFWCFWRVQIFEMTSSSLLIIQALYQSLLHRWGSTTWAVSPFNFSFLSFAFSWFQQKIRFYYLSENYVALSLSLSPNFQGEELRKLIGAPSYIECSSKTQEVCTILNSLFLVDITCMIFTAENWSGSLITFSHQNVKGVFDAAIKVVLQPPKQKKKKGKGQKACSILWSASQH